MLLPALLSSILKSDALLIYFDDGSYLEDTETLQCLKINLKPLNICNITLRLPIAGRPSLFWGGVKVQKLSNAAVNRN